MSLAKYGNERLDVRSYIGKRKEGEKYKLLAQERGPVPVSAQEADRAVKRRRKERSSPPEKNRTRIGSSRGKKGRRGNPSFLNPKEGIGPSAIRLKRAISRHPEEEKTRQLSDTHPDRERERRHLLARASSEGRGSRAITFDCAPHREGRTHAREGRRKNGKRTQEKHAEKDRGHRPFGGGRACPAPRLSRREEKRRASHPSADKGGEDGSRVKDSHRHHKGE